MVTALDMWKRFAPIGLFIFVFFVFTNIASYTYLHDWQPFAPRSIMAILFILFLPSVVEAVKRVRLRPLLSIAIYLIICGVLYFVSLYNFNTPANHEMFRTQAVELVFLFICCMIFLSDKNRKIAGYAIAAGLALGIVINLIEVLFPGFFSAVGGRSAGFYDNPNISGLALVIGWVLIHESLPNRYRTTTALLTGAGVFSTLSRTAIAIYLILLIFYLFKGTLSRGLRSWGINLVLIAALTTYLFCGYQYNPEFKYAVDSQTGGIVRNFIKKEPDSGETNTQGKRYTSKPAVIVLSTPSLEHGDINSNSSVPADNIEKSLQETLDKEYSDDSLSARAFIWVYSLNVIKQNPLWGIGMERAWAMSPHNMYLLMGLAYGILGWFVFPTFCLLVATNGRTRRSCLIALVLLLAGGFSHNLFVDRTVLLPVAAAMMLSVRPYPYNN